MFRERTWPHLGEDGGVYECVYNWRVLWMVCVGVLREYGCNCIVCMDCEYSR